MPASYIEFTDAIGNAFLRSTFPFPGDRFQNWTPTSRPFGDSVSRMGDGLTVLFKLRDDDYGASLDIGGIAVTTPPPPTGMIATTSTTGGTIPAGDHYYVVTAMRGGESVVSNEVHVVTTGTTSSVHLFWTAPSTSDFIEIRVWRGTTPGGENALVGTVSGGTFDDFLDTGALSTALTPAPFGIAGTAVADRLVAHLLSGGTCNVVTGDIRDRSYPTCALAPGSTPTLRLTDKRNLEYTLSLQLLNVAASPVRMECNYR